jgi:hypothetical protein
VEERHLMAGALSKMKQQLDNLDAGETNHSSSE